MPRKPPSDSHYFDEYDARAYRHLVPSGGDHDHDSSSSRKKSKKQKLKKVKRSKDRERSSHSHKESSQDAFRNKPNLVDYDDISSDSDINSNPTPPTSRVRGGGEGRRAISPATEIRQYQYERSHSNSPILIRDSPPLQSSHSSSRKHKKRPYSPEPLPREYSKSYGSSAPKAYAEPPKAYANPPKAYRDHSPGILSPRKRYRSRSPSPYSRKKNSSRYPEKYAKYRRSRSKTPSPSRSRSKRSRSRSHGRYSRSQRHSHSRSPHNRSSGGGSHSNKLSHSSVTYASSLAAELSKHRRAREAKEAAILAAKGKNSKDSRSSSNSKSHSSHNDVIDAKEEIVIKVDHDSGHYD
ncbi:hypothetical protein FSP39_002050 [Pinctada imbricata]|uniref:Uncharacterized protein n=1 Tax=Pinctada imbricata TaxID=66713 RepID=A0AA88YWH3_PINIB|nr:hypothetical protein FSP39_002050 [Pinctada imbricata]